MRANLNRVAFVKLGDISQQGVRSAVARAMDLADWDDYVKDRSMFLKINAMSAEVMPGVCTSPWVFEAVLHVIRAAYPNAPIYFGDADGYGTTRVEQAVANWGTRRIGEKYNAKFINLTKASHRIVCIGDVIGETPVPEILLNIDQIITLPVIKTHCLTTITGALKNQWGLLSEIRYRFHPKVHYAIPEINHFFSKIVFAIGDMTISLEGPGPRCGYPKICNLLLASSDLVALDSTAARYMGLNPYKIKYLQQAEKIGLGRITCNQVGDEIEPNSFKPARSSDHILYRWRDRFQQIPIVNIILFNSPLYRSLVPIATLYNRYWYRRYGRKWAEEICSSSNYDAEFDPLLK